MKTSELKDIALDWAVAEAEGVETWHDSCQILLVGDDEPYHPSTDWSQGGPIIERERIDVRWDVNLKYKEGTWIACVDCLDEMYGPTPLVAAMRCYVASKLGDEVDLPEGLK